MNPITLTQLSLGKLEVTPLHVDHPNRPFELNFKPVVGAYVLVREHEAPHTAPRLGRTNAHGLVVERDASDVHGPVDRVEHLTQNLFLWEVDTLAVPARDQMLLDTSVRYELFWCYDREQFESAHTALKAGSMTPALEAHPLAFEELRPPKLDLDLLPDVLRKKAAMHLFGTREGCIADSEHRRDICYVDVTPTALRSLYRAEFMEWYGATVLREGMKHWTVLARIKNIADLSAQGAPDFDLDARLKAHAAEGTRARAVLEHYRDFVWECVQTGAAPREVTTLLGAPVREVNHSEERQALIRSFAARKPAAVHPSIRPNARTVDSLLNDHVRSVLRDYVDLYTFGTELNVDDVGPLLQRATAEMNTASKSATHAVRDELSRSCRYDAFCESLATSTISDDERVELHKRYTRLSVRAGHKFWTAASDYTRHDWTSLEPFLKVLTNAGALSSEIWKELLSSEIKAMDASIEEAEELLTFLYRHHLASQQKTSTPPFLLTLPKAKAVASVDLAKACLRIDNGPALQLKLTAAKQSLTGGLPRPRGYAQGTSYSPVPVGASAVMRFEVARPSTSRGRASSVPKSRTRWASP